MSKSREAVQEKPAQGLSLEEIRIFDLMADPDEDRFWAEDELHTLRAWYAQSVRAYLASGCDPEQLRRALREFPNAANQAIAEWADTLQSMLDHEREPRSPEEIAELKSEIAACQRIQGRLEAGRVDLWMYAGNLT